ncbi:hypothetical protein [Amycolatopsis lurida]|uniref:hypothetical protein n=1 Tax=Amycolatopsis lurida TaxID=31959 RepID=UPI00364FDABF
MATLSSEIWTPRNSRPVLVAPGGVVIGTAPDAPTNRDALALVAMAKLGFRFSGAEDDDRELYFQRYCGEYVDLVSLRTDPMATSVAMRYIRAGFPWPRGQSPSPEIVVEDLLFDTILQLAEWPLS